MVRCGACRTQFDVPGEGRYSCPVCGSVNMVRSRAGAPGPDPMDTDVSAAPGPGQSPLMTPPPPPPPPPPDVPSPKVSCPECDFTFIVGSIDIATCPNCGAEVTTGVYRDPGDLDENVAEETGEEE